MKLNYTIRPDDPALKPIADLLAFHLAEMFAFSPPDKVHAMPIERLREPDVTFFSAWDGEALAAVGALKQLEEGRGEIKSMRAAPAYRGKGAGEAILLHLMREANDRGYAWIGLETGRPEPFLPAQQLYNKHGFAECPPFGDYISDGFSLCMSRSI